MSIEAIHVTANETESATPLLDQTNLSVGERRLIVRSIGHDGALVKYVRGEEGLDDHKTNLTLKAANFLGRDALNSIDFGGHKNEPTEAKLDAIVDELVESQVDVPLLEEATEILREKVHDLSDQVDELEKRVSPDVQSLYDELSRLQEVIRSKDANISLLQERLNAEIVKSGDKDRIIEALRPADQTLHLSDMPTTVPQDGTESYVLAYERPHTIMDEIRPVSGQMKRVGSMVARIVGVRVKQKIAS